MCHRVRVDVVVGIGRVILRLLRGMKPHIPALGQGVVRRIRVAQRTMVLAQGVVTPGTSS